MSSKVVKFKSKRKPVLVREVAPKRDAQALLIEIMGRQDPHTAALLNLLRSQPKDEGRVARAWRTVALERLSQRVATVARHQMLD